MNLTRLMYSSDWQRQIAGRARAALAIGLACLSLAAVAADLPDVQVETGRVRDVLQFKFSGRQEWKYTLTQEKRQNKIAIVLVLPTLATQAVQQLQNVADPFIEKIEVIEEGIDGQYRVTILTKDKDIEAFDYQVKDGNRLAVDIYRKEHNQIEPKPPRDLPKRKTADNKKVNARRPAGDFMAVPGNGEVPSDTASAGGSTAFGIFDGADPDFTRFNIEQREIKPEALIRSRREMYIPYPMLRLERQQIKTLQAKTPIYEIIPVETEENKIMRLILRLAQEGRYGLFLKTLAHFYSKYPKSPYEEMARFLEADMAYEQWKKSNETSDFEHAMSNYETAILKFPQSPLAERTMLLMGFTRLERGDNLGTIKAFDRFLRDRPESPMCKDVRIALAEAYLNLNKFDESYALLDRLEKELPSTPTGTEAAFRKGDIFMKQENWRRAIEEYDRTLKTYASESNYYPNALFNMAEAHFNQGNFKLSLDSHREFLRRFPSHVYGGFAMTRLGEVLEILGANPDRVLGAYLESNFRYRNSQGADVARMRVISRRLTEMRENELKAALEEMANLRDRSTLPFMKEFAAVLVSDSMLQRRDYDAAIEQLITYYQQNPTSQKLDVIRERIVRSIAGKVKDEVQKGEAIAALRTFAKYKDTWFRDSDRLDVGYSIGVAFEKLGVYGEAQNIYKDIANKLYALTGTSAAQEKSVFESPPTVDEVNLRLARVSIEEGQYSPAADYLRNVQNRAMMTPGQQIEWAEIAARVAIERGKSKEAKALLSHLVSTWRGIPEPLASPLLRLSRLQMEDGEWAPAQNGLQRIIQMRQDANLLPDENYSQALLLQAEVFERQKKPAEAVKVLENYLREFSNQPSAASVRYKLGQLYFEKGDLTNAERVWRPLAEEKSGVWYKLTQEKVNSSKWRNEYKKYLQRIPAVAGFKE